MSGKNTSPCSSLTLHSLKAKLACNANSFTEHSKASFLLLHFLKVEKSVLSFNVKRIFCKNVKLIFTL